MHLRGEQSGTGFVLGPVPAAKMQRPAVESLRKLAVGSLPLRGSQTVSAVSPARTRRWFKAGVFEEYLRLRDQERFPVVAAARALGLSASEVSGEGSMLARYVRGGLAGLESHAGGAGACDLTHRIEALGWFIPAAQFFFLSSKGKRQPFSKAVQRAAALPELPRGWSRDTSSRFLAHLNLAALPQCPADLLEELTKRQRDGKTIAPPRIMRLIKTSPSGIRRHCIEGPVEELAQINFQAIATRLAALEPGAICRAIIELA